MTTGLRPTPPLATCRGPILAISFCRSNSARRRAISSGDKRAIFEKSSFQSGLSLQRSGDCTVVRGAGAVSSTRNASSKCEGLRCRIVRPAGRIAEREIAEQEPRHADIFDDVLGASHDDRRDAVRFEVTGGQTHGLVTHRSNRDENSGVHFVFAQPRQQLRAILFEGHAVAAVGRRAVKARRHLADPPRPPPRAAMPAAGTRCCCPRPSYGCGRSRYARCADRGRAALSPE